MYKVVKHNCLFVLYLLSRKCEGLKGNFNTFLIIAPLFISASIPVTHVIGFSLPPLISLLTPGTTQKNNGPQNCYLGKNLTGFFFFP